MKDIQIGTLEAFNIHNLKDITHRITNMDVDILNSNVKLTIEKGTQVKVLNMPLQEAKDIGLINFDALIQKIPTFN